MGDEQALKPSHDVFLFPIPPVVSHSISGFCVLGLRFFLYSSFYFSPFLPVRFLDVRVRKLDFLPLTIWAVSVSLVPVSLDDLSSSSFTARI